MTNRYSQWRWGGLSGNWSISPAPKISSLKPHHSIKALHWSPIDPPSTWTSFAQAFITINEGQTTSTVINIHYLIWFVISGVWMRIVTGCVSESSRVSKTVWAFFTVIAQRLLIAIFRPMQMSGRDAPHLFTSHSDSSHIYTSWDINLLQYLIYILCSF